MIKKFRGFLTKKMDMMQENNSSLSNVDILETIKSNQVDAVESFLQDNNCCEENIISLAADQGKHEILEILLKNPKLNPCAKNNEALLLASLRGNYKCVELLLNDPRIDPSGQESEGLCRAILNGHVDIVSLFLKDGRSNPSVKENRPIRIGASRGMTKCVQLLLKHKDVNPSDFNNRAIFNAAQYNHISTVAELLRDDRVNPTDALAISSLYGHLKVVELIVRHKNCDVKHNDFLVPHRLLDKFQEKPLEIIFRHPDMSSFEFSSDIFNAQKSDVRSGSLSFKRFLLRYRGVQKKITKPSQSTQRQYESLLRDNINVLSKINLMKHLPKHTLALAFGDNIVLKRDPGEDIMQRSQQILHQISFCN